MGKMGQEVLRALCRDPELEPVAGVDVRGEHDELPLPDGTGTIPLSAKLEPTIVGHRPDVLVDFSVAEATMPTVRIAVENDVRLVVGTTGLSPADLDEIKGLCSRRGLGAVVAPNFSVAAVVMVHLARTAARFFDYAEVIEMHHEQKVDAPSGTAIATANEMVNARGRPFEYARAQKMTVAGSRGGELDGVALHSVRLPGLLAHQEVILGAPGQTLRIRLDQINREAFMPGVTLAIKGVVKLNEAVFGLDKLLGL